LESIIAEKTCFYNFFDSLNQLR